ncbi:MAG: hypothetical protein GEU82_17030 [Luteitalea sp.]|nr:hypothetical protein [Luteitalea sp.]
MPVNPFRRIGAVFSRGCKRGLEHCDADVAAAHLVAVRQRLKVDVGRERRPRRMQLPRAVYTPRRISNHRLVAVSDDTVSFRWTDYRHGSQMRTLTLEVDEFLRRFLLHVLPKRFVRMRYFGLLAPRCRTKDLATCRRVLAVAPPPSVTAPSIGITLSRSWPCAVARPCASSNG